LLLVFKKEVLPSFLAFRALVFDPSGLYIAEMKPGFLPAR
jgi:hypothetical protein